MAELATAEGPLLETILAATHEIWSEGLTPRAYRLYYAGQRATPWGSRNLERVALVEGTEVLASAKLYSFTAILDGDPVRVLGLGAVFTQPAHRGRGVARELLERLMARATRDGVDVALLFSEIGPDYYARLGFATIPTTTKTLRVVESTRHGAPATLVRAGEDRDLAAIVAIGDARNNAHRFHLMRDRDVVHYAIAKKRLLAGLGAPGAREAQFFVAEEGGNAVAYVVIMVRRDGPNAAWLLEECGDRDPTGARVGAMLQALIARDPAEARPRITAWLPHGFKPPQIEIASEQPSTDVMMMRGLSERAKAAAPLRGEDVLYWHSDAF